MNMEISKIEYRGGLYTGQFYLFRAHGFGTLYANGTVYEGDWRNGEMHGKGEYTYANGSVYYGDWRDGKERGKGRLTLVKGTVYYGDWRDGRLHGKGEYTYASGDV